MHDRSKVQVYKARRVCMLHLRTSQLMSALRPETNVFTALGPSASMDAWARHKQVHMSRFLFAVLTPASNQNNQGSTTPLIREHRSGATSKQEASPSFSNQT